MDAKDVESADAAPADDESANENAADGKSADAEPADGNLADAKAAEAKAAADNAAEETAADGTAAGKAADGTGADGTAADKAADEAAAGESAADKAAADETGSGKAAAKRAKGNLADIKAAEARAAERKAAKQRPAERRRAPLSAEKAPPLSKEEALRAQAKRRLEEPAPRTLRISLYLFLGAGIIWVLVGVLFLVNKQSYIDALVKDKNNTLTDAETASSVTQLLWFYIVIAVVFAVFLGLFAYKATEGTRRARTLVTIFAAVLVLFHLFLFQSQPGILSAMFALVGLFLLWSPSSRRYFPPRQVP